MKHQQSAVHAAPSVAVKKRKPVHSVVKIKAVTKPGNHAADHGDGRLEMIRQTAYSLYEARNCESGHELEDWLRAEAQVDQISGAKAPVSQSLM